MLCESKRKIGYSEESYVLNQQNASPLDEVVNATQLRKSQMVVQLATSRIICYNLCVPIMSDPPPAVLLRFECMSLAATIPMLGAGELRCAGRLSLLEALIAPPERDGRT